ncbi:MULTISPECIES: hypothetical protein [unclassified Streptomyces]|uniref:hypothetical protein n=1 Tax=unclassified Streptomyces TaxID=2593676 RepID=UPI0036EC9B79
MTTHQNAVEAGEFAQYLRAVVAFLDPAGGWYGVFCRRDPGGMRACLDGAEIPPWDVMESLFQDLAAVRGAAFAQRESVRAADLYAASVATHDRRPGGRQLLVERLELMLREQAGAARRLRAAGAPGTAPPDADAVAWARDDHERATARCAELRGRLAAVTVPRGWFRTEDPASRDQEAEPAPEPTPAPASAPQPAPAPAPAPSPEPGPAPESGPGVPPPAARSAATKGRRPRGARFAGLEVDEADTAPAAAAPVLPVPPVTAAAPRGARFGAAPQMEDASRTAVPAAPDSEAVRVAVHAVGRLLGLRAADRGGEAHVVLFEAAGWPADRLPALADELHRVGLDADWATVLWEVSALPPFELGTVADALAAAGRSDDSDHLLRQGVARPAAEIAEAAVALDRAGRGKAARALLVAFIRVRTPQEAARVAEHDPHRLVPQVLTAAGAVSAAREREVVHALRVAGLVGAPRSGR